MAGYQHQGLVAGGFHRVQFSAANSRWIQYQGLVKQHFCSEDFRNWKSRSRGSFQFVFQSSGWHQGPFAGRSGQERLTEFHHTRPLGKRGFQHWILKCSGFRRSLAWCMCQRRWLAARDLVWIMPPQTWRANGQCEPSDLVDVVGSSLIAWSIYIILLRCDSKKFCCFYPWKELGTATPLICIEVNLFLDRLCVQWDGFPHSMKKAFTFKEGSAIHLCCGLFIHFVEVLRQEAPASEYESIAGRLRQKFLLGVMDHELKAQSETNVPPGDMKALSAFRPGWTKRVLR